MSRQSLRSLLMKRDGLPFLSALIITWLLVLFMPSPYARWFLGPTATAFILLAGALYVLGDWVMDKRDHTVKPRDPWVMQCELMCASGQPVPSTPTLSKNSLMYAALILEEAAEILRDGVVPGMDKVQFQDFGPVMTGPLDTLEQGKALARVRGKLQSIADDMTQQSVMIRQELALIQDFAHALDPEDPAAVAIFDGTTDLTVVNCGFALASGLPAAEGYKEVAQSNLSKCNPDTGRIDKTPDGKWIKGAQYREPDLRRVLLGREAR